MNDVNLKYVFESKVPNSGFWKLSNTGVCHISVALNVDFNFKRCFNDVTIYRKWVWNG